MHPLWAEYISSNTQAYSHSLESGGTDNLVFLEHLGVLQLHGDGAAGFLQGYVSCDTAKLSPQRSLFGAMCDIKGRVITSFYLLEIEGIPSFVLRTDIIESIKIHLEKYLVFSKCTLQDASEEFVILGQIRTTQKEPHTTKLQVTHCDGLHKLEVDAERQLLVCNPEAAIQQWSTADIHLLDTLWKLADLKAGIIMPGPEVSGLHLPQSLNMTGDNSAVDFNKGCYLGQEIIARVEHRGNLKRQLAIFSWKTTANMGPQTGDDISNSVGKSIGQVVQIIESAPGEGLLAGVVLLPKAVDKFYAGETNLTLLHQEVIAD